MTDKTQIERDVAGARAYLKQGSDIPCALEELCKLMLSPAFAAQFDALVGELIDDAMMGDHETARARLREFVLGVKQ